MRIKAILVCEDVRLEVAGTLTAVGIYNERLVVEPGEAPIVIPKFAVLVVLAGLKGTTRIACRQRVARVGDPYEAPPPSMIAHEHSAENDEHSFVFQQTPLVVGAPGLFHFVFEARSDQGALVHDYSFSIERQPPAILAAPPPPAAA